jgi:hypothetical protein
MGDTMEAMNGFSQQRSDGKLAQSFMCIAADPAPK